MCECYGLYVEEDYLQGSVVSIDCLGSKYLTQIVTFGGTLNASHWPHLPILKLFGVSEMAQCIKMTAFKHDNLNSFPQRELHDRGKELTFTYSLISSHAVCAPVHASMH